MQKNDKEPSRKQPEQESEKEIKQLIDASPVAMVVSLGIEERVESVNNKFIELFGYTIEDMPNVEHWWPLAYPDEKYREKIRTQWRTKVEQAIKNKSQIEPMEATVACKDGSQRYVEFRLSSIGEKHLVTFVDLTKRKQTEEKLRASEQLFRALVENSPDFVARYDKEFRRIYVNPAIQRLFTSPVESALGKTPNDQTPLYAPQEYIEHLKYTIETATESVLDTPFRTAQGEMHWGQIRFVPEFDSDGKVTTVLTIGRDIHEIKENEQRFRMLAENFPDFVIRFDRDSQCTYVNPAIEEAFGIPAEAIIGKTLQELPYFGNQKQNDALMALIQLAFDEGIPKDAEALWNTETGERTFEIRCAPEKDAAENVASVLIIARDITERTQAEDELRQNREAALQFSKQLATLQEVTNDLSKVESSDDLCLLAVQLGRLRLGFDRISIWFIEEHLGIMRGSFGTDEHGELRDERNAQVEFTHQGLAWRVFSQKEPAALVEPRPLRDHLGQVVGEGDNAVAALWDGDEVIGIISVDNYFTGHPIRERQLEILRLYAATLGHLITRKRVEEALRASEEKFRSFVESSSEGFTLVDEQGTIIEWNAAREKMTGLPASQVIDQKLWDVQYQMLLPKLRTPEFYERFRQTLLNALQTGQSPIFGQVMETEVMHPHSPSQFIQQTIFPIKTDKGYRIGSVTSDITERKQAEEEHQVHLQFLESMDRVNRAIQGTNDIEQMMSDVLDIVLSIFDCDRAFLMYPCDPDASSWFSPMERTRPEYPGVLAKGMNEIPMDAEVAKTLRIMLDADGPVKFGSGSSNALPADISERFSIKSFMSMALRPKIDKPWQFGIHQCAYERFWTPGEERLFQEIGRRLSDALTSLLTHRQLQESEERYRLIAENTVDTISVFDLHLQPIYVSPSVFRLRGYTVEEAMVQSLDQILTPASLQMANTVFAKQLAMEASGTANPARTALLELEEYCKDRSTIWVELAASALRGSDLQPTGILTVSRDITERKRHDREREAIITVSNALRQARTRVEILNVILNQLVDLFDADGSVLVLPDPQTGGLINEMGSGTIGERMVGLKIPSGKGVGNWVITKEKAYLNNRADQDSIFYRPDLLGDSHCLVAAPLIAQEQAIGALLVARRVDFIEQDLRLLVAIADIAANAIHRVTLHERTEQQLHRLTALHQIDLAISTNIDINVTLNVFLGIVKEELEVDAASVLLLNPITHVLDYVAGIGFRAHHIERSHVRLGNGCAGLAAQEHRTVSCVDIGKGGGIFVRSSLLASEEFISHYVTPLVVKGQIKGVLEVFHRKTLEPDDTWLNYFETLATQAAIAIENTSLFENLQRSNMELTLAYDATIEGWSRALDLRDRETEGHTQRVAEMALNLAEKMGMSDVEMRDLRRGALLHDIGKMGVPDMILRKPGPLSEDEWEIMRQHPVYAYQMLSPIQYLKHALEIPYCHHEKWDGSGYPRGLKGEEIPLSARVFAVVDVFDALTSDRPYSKAWPFEDAYQYIIDQAGKHFDPQIVKKFIKFK